MRAKQPARPAASSQFAPRLVIMVKEPVAGRVKTRLARGIGTVAAIAAYRTMLSGVAGRLSRDRRWQTVFAISPDAALASRMLPSCGGRIPQGGGNLGDRLQRLFDRLPPGPVVVIGTDIPAILPADIAAAFQALGTHDAVFGPSSDGGYWLIGLKRRPRTPLGFAGVRWSSEHALADTVTNLKRLRVSQCRYLDDVDTASDFKHQREVIGRRVLPRANASR